MKDIRMPLHAQELEIPRKALPSMAERVLIVQRLLVTDQGPMELKDIVQMYEQV